MTSHSHKRERRTSHDSNSPSDPEFTFGPVRNFGPKPASKSPSPPSKFMRQEDLGNVSLFNLNGSTAPRSPSESSSEVLSAIEPGGSSESDIVMEEATAPRSPSESSSEASSAMEERVSKPIVRKYRAIAPKPSSEQPRAIPVAAPSNLQQQPRPSLIRPQTDTRRLYTNRRASYWTLYNSVLETLNNQTLSENQVNATIDFVTKELTEDQINDTQSPLDELANIAKKGSRGALEYHFQHR